jgi:SAM-dependent methyltransferase
MNAMDVNLSNEVVRWQERLFQRSVRRRMRFQQIRKLLGAVSGQRCLEISAGDGVLSRHLHAERGEWTTIALNEQAQTSLNWFHEEVSVLPEETTIDAPDQSFDAVVLVDVLERIQDDYSFIHECHRVLKTDGRLVISVARRGFFGFLDGSWRKRGRVRPGYTGTEFFDVLKDGFDVPETVSYATALVEIPGRICEAIANAMTGGAYTMPPSNADTEAFYHYRKLYALGTLVYPVMWILEQLDQLLLMVFRGRNLAAKTKRRVWRERRTPVLVDGRSIAEAALNTKIGTAAPF